MGLTISKAFLVAVVLSLISTAVGEGNSCKGGSCTLSESELRSRIGKAYQKGYAEGHAAGYIKGKEEGSTITYRYRVAPYTSTDIKYPTVFVFDPETGTWRPFGNPDTFDPSSLMSPSGNLPSSSNR